MTFFCNFRKREEDFQEKSYEQWLQDKEGPVKKKPIVVKQIQSGPHIGVPNVKVGSGTHAGPHIGVANVKGGSGAHTAEGIIKNIFKRRQEEQTSSTVSKTYDDWMVKKDGDILEQIRAGKTPLQMMMQQGKV